LLDTGTHKVLIDCGAFQGSDELEKINRSDFPFDPREIDFVFLSHAHFDHCGRLPKLVKEGFKGKILCTQPTRDLTSIVLHDAAKLQAEEYKRWESRHKDDDESGLSHSEEGNSFAAFKPMYDEEDVEKTLGMMEVYPFGNSIHVADGLELRMRDSGHILGSASFEIWAENEVGRIRKIVFSGDLGQPGQRIVRDPDMIREADYVIVESTYGNRLHKSKDETVLEFLSILKQAQKDGGNILIPTFAIERAQEILYELNLFFENRLIENMEVYLDSPMAKKATEVFQRYPSFYDEDARRLLEKGDNPFDFKGFNMIESVDESKRLIAKRGVAIMAGSGMCNGGRIVHHLANNIERKNTHIIFVGYQVDGTLGRRIIDGDKPLRIKGREVVVGAQIHTLGGFSAHADARDLRYWLRGFGHSPRTIFVVHGEESIAEEFAKNIKEEIRVDTYVPSMNEEIDLD
jgi:metallo-beta-lactamase family protein